MTDYADPKAVCKCGFPVKVGTAKTAANQRNVGRMFVSCKMSKQGCGLFQWLPMIESFNPSLEPFGDAFNRLKRLPPHALEDDIFEVTPPPPLFNPPVVRTKYLLKLEPVVKSKEEQETDDALRNFRERLKKQRAASTGLADPVYRGATPRLFTDSTETERHRKRMK